MSSCDVTPTAELVAAPIAADEIRRAIVCLHRPGDVVEVRVPKAGRNGTVSGYFAEWEPMVSELERLDSHKFPGVYCTLNPVSPVLLGRADNRLKRNVDATTKDADVVQRIWLPIDLDPCRPAGVSSSDAEHAAALEMACAIRSRLAEEGWPEPVLADSGNGAHLLYRLDLPNDEESAALVKRVLQALSDRHSNGMVAVDLTTYNASRIFKAYGTTARKGDNTATRPHRVSRILEIPTNVEIVAVELLRALAAEAPTKPTGRIIPMPRAALSAFDLEKFLQQHGVRYRPPVAFEGGRKFVLEECPWDSGHGAPDAAVFEGADGRLGFKCFHNSCQGRGWREFRELIDPDHCTRQAVSGLEDSRAVPQESEGGDDNTPSVFHHLAPYPSPLGEDAYYGIAGRFVRLVEPHTEADPSFMLIQFLAYAGNMLGRRAFVWAGADKHYPNLFICGVGPTSSGRKGSAAGPAQLFFKDIDEDWVRSIQSGLSSGEGLIWCVRDPIYRREKVSQGKGKAAQYDDVLIDPGVADKRLLVQQSEFFGALQAMRRQGNNLSPTIRDAFDKGHLNSMVKNSPAKATGAHISIVGNVTKEELLRGMLVEEMDNGFANRFLWACSRRSKCLPEGGRMWEVIESEPFRELQRQFNRASYTEEVPVRRDGDASDIWGYDERPDAGVYSELTQERHGMYGACTARAAAITLRVSLIYALLDEAREIRKEHLLAALEVWRYCDDSAKYIFGDTLGDPTADEILRALRAAPGGLTRTEIAALFDRHKAVSEISRALMVLHNRSLVRFEQLKTRGRPVEKWFAVWQVAPAEA